jgi:hypothetical protein
VDDYLAIQPNATIFHTPTWQQFIHEAGGADTRWAVAIDTHARVTGVMPFTVGPGASLQSPPEYLETIYGGPLAIDSGGGARLLRAAAESGPFRASHLAPPPGTELTSAKSVGYRLRKSFLTSLIDVTYEEDHIWAGLDGKRVRNPIRKSIKAGVVAADGTADDLAAYYALMAQTMSSAMHRLPPMTFYQHALDQLANLGLLRFVVARLNTEIVAGAMFLVYGGKSWYWNGAASDRGRELAASDLVQWEHIRWAARAGNTSYDLLRYDPTASPGIASFKRKFGGREVQLYSADKETLGGYLQRAVRAATNPRRALRAVKRRWGPHAQ